MPRLAEGRAPAVPVTDVQRERCARMLAAAARLGAKHGLERVQMAEVAQQAGVALGTLYRYYPSKHHLFAAVLTDRVGALDPGRTGGDPAEAVAELMAQACRAMLRAPLLARAMITSINVVRSDEAAHDDARMRDLILAVAGIADPGDADLRLARLVEQCAYGVLTWAAAGESTPAEAEEDVRRACLLLLAPWR